MAVDTRLYDTLGVPPTASAAEIKKAFRKLALTHHPDKGGDVERFQEITAAHEVLSSEETRRVYDRYGQEGLKQSLHSQDGAAGGVTPDDLFGSLFGDRGLFGSRSTFFGSGGGSFFDHLSGQQQRQAQKPKTTRLKLDLTLEEAFAGTVREVKVLRRVVCGACQGSGIADASAMFSCPECSGAGIRVVERRIGHMVQRLQVTCQACQGVGQRLSANALCRSCRGRGQRKEMGDLEVQVPAGVADGHMLLLRGKGDQVPGQRPGDLLYHVHVMEHPRFRRLEEHLEYHAKVPLAEALAGCRISVEHLDGRTLALRTPSGDVVRPDSCWRLKGHGMPFLGQAAERGDLQVRFDVVFPDQLDARVSGQIRDILLSAPGSTPCRRNEGSSLPQLGRLSNFLSALRALFWKIPALPAQSQAEGTEDGTNTDSTAAEEEYLILEQLGDTAEPEDSSRQPRSKL